MKAARASRPTERAREPEGFRIGPLTHYADPAAMRDWLAAAEPGRVLIYAIGPALGDHAAGRLARQWYDAGLVELLPQVRNRDRAHCFDYTLRKKAGAAASAPPAEGKRSADGEELRRLMAELRRCAERTRPCPSNAELARALQLPGGKPGRNRVQYLMRVLAERGRIAVESRGTCAPRVVTILAPGRACGSSTAAGVLNST